MPSTSSGERRQLRPFRVGEWTVEPTLLRVTRGDHSIQLRPRAMEVLVCLAESGGAVVSRRELIDRVWRTEFVTTNALTHVVAELRSVLGDTRGQSNYIETIPRRGYRLVAEASLVRSRPSDRESATRFSLADEQGAVIQLAEGDNLVGRSPEAAIRVDSSEVSRRHALIVVTGSHATLEDLGSKNGTFLRGRLVDRPMRLQGDDEIQIGVEVAKFRVITATDRTKTEKLRKG